ncbi:nucleoside triphosphate pyrophosphohydrolase [Jeotgalibacillus campisalis]|uniref:Phosphoribosyl-ATP pyrophosphohydrolase n=1 Tax=Jeotgalibacillus campisalis TaxID=220754 RepID=A0A0C2SAX4_9BACL|nr:nucleoside triphosphate pyrophosphohydrolase [Jeotgalibacillus campisalis]KIL51089.1 hypothetical protein KR50_09700 [Jeotgalibacillus campisalis]
MPKYNKLVRDYIPQIIEQSGSKYSVKTLGNEEYIIELKKKMHEEIAEYEEAKNDQDAVEELADLLELVYAAAESHGTSVEHLERVRMTKAEKRGAFKDKVFLIEVEDE